MEALPKAYMGKILRVNLSDGNISEVSLPLELIKGFIGGRGVAAKILYDELKPKIDPFSPENKLIFTNGPLACTDAQSCGRWMVTTKSPLTGGMFRSTAGGDFGAELKSAGFDILIVEGKAEKPAYLWINDDAVILKSADELWGLLNHETAIAIRRQLTDQKIKVVSIGPAGEKKVRFAAIADNRKTASRGGVGAIMGAKNLKAIAVRGSGRTGVFDRERILSITKKHSEIVKTSSKIQAFKHLGTAAVVNFAHEVGVYPVKNFKEGVMPEVMDTLSPDKLEALFVKDARCCQCHIRCGCIMQVKKGPYAGEAVDGPEYETLYAFGGEVGNNSLEMIIEANRICDDYGVDTISAGCCIGFAMECHERGILSRNDLDNIELSWGNSEAIIVLLKKIVSREGIGDMLAEGTKIAAGKIGKGAEQFAMQVKGLELPGYEPRGIKGCSLNFATAALGASHCVGQTYQEYIGGEGLDRFAVEGKAKLCKYNQDKTALLDSGIVCIFAEALGVLTMEDLKNLLYAATGVDEFNDLTNLFRIGERIWNIERAFNVREGFSRKDDYLPHRFMDKPLNDGPVKGAVVELDRLLDDYYDQRGWDRLTGYPTRETLERLDLKAVADDLEKMGSLG